MSINLLHQSEKVHTLEDDLEAFFWVVFWVSLVYAESNRTSKAIQTILVEVFNQSLDEGKGGLHKHSLLLAKAYIGGMPPFIFSPAPLNYWFWNCVHAFARWHRMKEARDDWELMQATLVPTDQEPGAEPPEVPEFTHDRLQKITEAALNMSWPLDDPASDKRLPASLKRAASELKMAPTPQA